MGTSPIADAYSADRAAAQAQPRYSLDVYSCRTCGHAQLLEVVPPELLFGDYTFRTKHSLGLVEHFRKYSQNMLARLGSGAHRIYEIGSNDGTLLQFFQQEGCQVLGIDPAPAIAAEANEQGVETVCAFFTPELAAQLTSTHGRAECVAANNVFAHADDMLSMLRGIRELLSDTGFFVFEVSYLVDIVEKMLFDTIYHEHLGYHSVKPLVRFFQENGMELFEVERIATKGGSIRGFAQRAGGPRKVHPSLQELLELERRQATDSPDYLRRFADQVELRRRELIERLEECRRAGQSIVGFGASATVTTLLYRFDLFSYLDYLVDDNIVKQGTFCPGGQLQVHSPERLHQPGSPDQVVILAWNYAVPILKKHAAFQEKGGRFVIPLPTVQ